jgi:hypothetical protein
VQVSIELSGFKEVVELLDVFQRTHVKFALQESLNKGLAPALREYERGHIERTFNDPVPLTLKAPITTEWANFNSLQINFKHIDQISGGTSPSVYLRPQVTGGQVNVTRLNRALQATGLIGSNQYLWWWGSGRGPAAPSRMTGAFAQRIKAAVTQEGGEFFILPKQRLEPGAAPGIRKGRNYLADRRDTGYVGPGIYRSRGGQVEQVFKIINNIPTVPAKYDWTADRLRKFAEPVFSEAVIDNLDKALRV